MNYFFVSQYRVDAIRNAEEERDIKTANRVNPLDEELIKTKGLLRAPSARKDPARRLSAEVKEQKDVEVACSGKISDDGAKGTEVVHKHEEKSDEVKNELNCQTEDLSSDGEKSTEVQVLPTTSRTGYSSSPSTLSINSSDGGADIHKDNQTNGESLQLLSGSMPDITVQVPRTEHVSESSSTTEDTDGNTSSIAVVTPESDTEFDSSEESLPTEESESIRPGHVKDLIARVDSFSKVSDQPVGDKLVGARSPTVSFCDKTSSAADFNGTLSNPEDITFTPKDINGAEYDRVNQFVALDSNVKTTKSKETVDKTVDNETDTNQVSLEGDVVYVAKSLPELAQVFEPGELKAKKRKGKSEKGKSGEHKS